MEKQLGIKFTRQELQWVTFETTVIEEDWNEWKEGARDIPDEVKALTFKEVCDIFDGKKDDIHWIAHYWNDVTFDACVLDDFGDFIRDRAIDQGPLDSNYADGYDADEEYKIREVLI